MPSRAQITAAAYRAFAGVSELMFATETLRANDSVVLAPLTLGHVVSMVTERLA